MKTWSIVRMLSLGLVFIGNPLVGFTAGSEMSSMIPADNTNAAQVQGEGVSHVFMGKIGADDQLGVRDEGGLVSSPVANSADILSDGYENGIEDAGSEPTFE